MSQDALGKSLGLTFQQIQKYEKGVNRIGASRLFELAELLDVPIQFFYNDYANADGTASGFAEPEMAEAFMDLVNSPEGVQLCRYFAEIKDPKVCDRISDEIVDLIYREAEKAEMSPWDVRVACETLTTTNKVVIAGEVRAPESLMNGSGGVKPEAFVEAAREAIKSIGYEQDGFHWRTADIDVLLHGQSADIAQGVDNAADANAEGAGDQGIMFGYACRETPSLMPAPIYYSHKILEDLAAARHAKEGDAGLLGPDAKSQVTVRYENGEPVEITSIVLSTQHLDDSWDSARVRSVVEPYIRKSVADLPISDACEWHAALERVLGEVMDLSPSGIRRKLDLNKPIYARTAAYGHFGGSLNLLCAAYCSQLIDITVAGTVCLNPRAECIWLIRSASSHEGGCAMGAGKQVIAGVAAVVLWNWSASAQTLPEEFSLDENVQEPGDASIEAAARLRDLVSRLDPQAEFNANGALFTISGVSVTFIYDINADRMRLVSPVASVGDIEPEIFLRMMQANFDSALDARYGVAQDIVWSTFIHPLSSLTSEEFGAGVAQTVNLVRTFGDAYSSGVLAFGGGDSITQERELVDELTDKSRDI
ncbi:S-adenosylmethionine synthase (AdoMet synthase) (MAT) (Methionine adenosyltransferase) [Durusdinium trenchii]|uniref:methionine adenosyltransferase n=1 Tax=Durusdinium trenchii TaxID=1381693 RepID=A0ABP0LJG9_9DINO